MVRLKSNIMVEVPLHRLECDWKELRRDCCDLFGDDATDCGLLTRLADVSFDIPLVRGPILALLAHQ